MTRINIKRVYEQPDAADGYRVLADRLWPRGMKKENLKYDLWAKDITPSTSLRMWFHEDPAERWKDFAAMYRKELSESPAVKEFVEQMSKYPVVTLLYASRDKEHNHARILQEYLQEKEERGGRIIHNS